MSATVRPDRHHHSACRYNLSWQHLHLTESSLYLASVLRLKIQAWLDSLAFLFSTSHIWTKRSLLCSLSLGSSPEIHSKATLLERGWGKKLQLVFISLTRHTQFFIVASTETLLCSHHPAHAAISQSGSLAGIESRFCEIKIHASTWPVPISLSAKYNRETSGFIWLSFIRVGLD